VRNNAAGTGVEPVLLTRAEVRERPDFPTSGIGGVRLGHIAASGAAVRRGRSGSGGRQIGGLAGDLIEWAWLSIFADAVAAQSVLAYLAEPCGEVSLPKDLGVQADSHALTLPRSLVQ
jgi:hypothetical protein